MTGSARNTNEASVGGALSSSERPDGLGGAGPEAAPADYTVKDGLALTPGRKRLLLIVILSATFMQLLDISIVGVAISSIQQSLQASFANTQLVLVGYQIGFAAFLTAGVSHLVMGRGTYDKVLTFGSWPYERFRVLVLSTTLSVGDDQRVTVVRSTAEAQQRLDADAATGVYVDGGQVLTDFLRRGLVDELTITRAPVILGRGLPLFHDLPDQVRLVHRGTASLGAGMVSTRYDVTHEDQHEH